MHSLTLTQLKEPLLLEKRPDLDPAPGEVVVRLQAAALNRRDFWITQGMYPGIELPVVLGSDGAGIVYACGDGVDSAWKDCEVIINPGLDWGDEQSRQDGSFTILGLPRDGTLATEVAIPATQLVRRPAHLNWQQAAALPLAGVTAYRALFSRGGVEPGQSVLITGIGGGVATFALQFAITAGARVWVTSSSSDKIQRAIEMGAEGGVNYREENWAKDLIKRGGPPNLIIDGAGGKGYSDLLHIAAPGGRIVNYGATAGPAENVELFRLFWKQLHLIGSTMGSPADFADMVSMVERHAICPIIDKTLPLSEGNQAIDLMRDSRQFGKIVLDIASSDDELAG